MKDLKKFEVANKIGVSLSALETLIRSGSFPVSIKLGDSEKSTQGWIDTEVDAWLEQKMS